MQDTGRLSLACFSPIFKLFYQSVFILFCSHSQGRINWLDVLLCLLMFPMFLPVGTAKVRHENRIKLERGGG